MMRIITTFLIFLFFNTFSAQITDSEGFRLITSNDAGDNYYVKTEKIDRSPFDNRISAASYWVRIEKAEKKIKGKDGKLKNILGDIVLQFFNCSCADKTFTLEETHRYSSKGKLLKSDVYSGIVASPSRAIPGTLGETMLNAVCLIID